MHEDKYELVKECKSEQRQIYMAEKVKYQSCGLPLQSGLPNVNSKLGFPK